MISNSINTHRWCEGAVAYQIYPRSFNDSNSDGIGDLAGITAKLSYLAELGVNVIWLSPFYPSPMVDFGYDVSNYTDVDPLFGSMNEFREMLTAAHDLDLRVMIDLVPNHTSQQHLWFQASRASKTGTYADWYMWRDAAGAQADGTPIPPNNWVSMFNGDSAWQWDDERKQFYLHSFDALQPDLNWSNPAVRAAIGDVMRFWLDAGVDGFRVDAVSFLAKDTELRDDPVNPNYRAGTDHKRLALLPRYSQGAPALFEYLHELAEVLNEPAYVGRDGFMVVEGAIGVGNPAATYADYYRGIGPRHGAPFNFDGLSLPWQADVWRYQLTEYLNSLAATSADCVPSFAFGNHDTARIVSRSGEMVARAAAVLLLTLPGINFIYNGDELGMTDGRIAAADMLDPAAVGGAGREPQRTPMQWSGERNAGFTNGASTWLPLAAGYETRNAEVEAVDPSSFLSLYRRLGMVRNATNALKYGAMTILDAGQAAVLAYSREYAGELCTTFINFSADVVTVVAPIGKVLVSAIDVEPIVREAGGPFILRPHEAVVIHHSPAH